MNDDFKKILEKLGHKLNILLVPNQNNQIDIRIDGKITLSIKQSQKEREIILGTEIADLPAGKYREEVFLQTLKYNATIPSSCFFGFNEKDIKLVLFQFLHITNLSSDILYQNIANFVDIALSWQKAIENNETAPISFLRENIARK